MASRRTLQRRLLTALTGVVMAAMTTPGVAAVPGGCGVACLVPVRLERLGRDAAVVHLPPDVPHSAAAAKFDVPTGLPEVAHVAVTLFTDAVTAQPLATTDPDGRLGALVALFRDVPTPAWQAALGETAPGAEMAATALFLAPQGPWRLPVPPGAAGGGPPVQVPQAFMLVRPAAGWPFDRVLMHGAATLRHGLRPRPGLLAEARSKWSTALAPWWPRAVSPARMGSISVPCCRLTSRRRRRSVPRFLPPSRTRWAPA